MTVTMCCQTCGFQRSSRLNLKLPMNTKDTINIGRLPNRVSRRQ